MNSKIICLLAVISLPFSGAVLAAGAKTYQITGTVVEATGSKVTLEKGTDRFEFDIDPATTKGSAELKVGSTVTVTYVMSATKSKRERRVRYPHLNPLPEGEVDAKIV
jgi:hypothetical protein